MGGVLCHGVLRMRIRDIIIDKTSEVPACVDPPLEAESCHVTILSTSYVYFSVQLCRYQFLGPHFVEVLWVNHTAPSHHHNYV